MLGLETVLVKVTTDGSTYFCGSSLLAACTL